MKAHDYEMGAMIKRILTGCIFYNLILILSDLLFYPQISVFIGLLTGMIVAIIMTIHMAYSVSIAMLAGEPESVRRKVTISSTVRKVVFAAIFIIIVLMYAERVNPLAFVVGSMGLKAGAYYSAIWEHRKRREEII